MVFMSFILSMPAIYHIRSFRRRRRPSAPSCPLVAVVVLCPSRIVANWKRCRHDISHLPTYYRPDFEPWSTTPIPDCVLITLRRHGIYTNW